MAKTVTTRYFPLYLYCPLLSFIYLTVSINAEPYQDCYVFPVEEMKKLLYVVPGPAESVKLDCKTDKAIWDRKEYPDPDASYKTVASPAEIVVDGYNLDGSTLDIGKATKDKSGYYCCKKIENYVFSVVETYAVLVLSKEPTVTVTSSVSGPVDIDTEITLTCSQPTDNVKMDQAIQPTIKWEVPSKEKVNSETPDNYAFKATTDLNGKSFRCAWSYDLYGNGTLVQFHSDPFILQVKFSPILDEKKSTPNKKPVGVKQGGETTLKCVFSGNPGVSKDDKTFSWKWISLVEPEGDEKKKTTDSCSAKNDNNLSTMVEKQVKNGDEGYVVGSELTDGYTTTFTLTIKDFSRQKAGCYICALGALERSVNVIADVQLVYRSKDASELNDKQTSISSQCSSVSVALLLIPILAALFNLNNKAT